MKYIGELLLWSLFWTWLFGLLFSSYAAFHRSRREGTFRREHWFIFGPTVLIGMPLDIVWNSSLGAVFFGELPWQNWDWTFTARIAKHVKDTDWRGTEARVWKGLLNALDPGHIS